MSRRRFQAMMFLTITLTASALALLLVPANAEANPPVGMYRVNTSICRCPMQEGECTCNFSL